MLEHEQAAHVHQHAGDIQLHGRHGKIHQKPGRKAQNHPSPRADGAEQPGIGKRRLSDKPPPARGRKPGKTFQHGSPHENAREISCTRRNEQPDKGAVHVPVHHSQINDQRQEGDCHAHYQPDVRHHQIVQPFLQLRKEADFLLPHGGPLHHLHEKGAHERLQETKNGNPADEGRPGRQEHGPYNEDGKGKNHGPSTERIAQRREIVGHSKMLEQSVHTVNALLPL
jgi:hypothetical protein